MASRGCERVSTTTSFRGVRSTNPESRDSGSGPSDHPGMTRVNGNPGQIATRFPFRSAQHRQLNHIIRMLDAALQHGVFEFILKTAGGADAAFGGEGTAEHRAAVGQAGFAE